jgi:hypothetical protein
VCPDKRLIPSTEDRIDSVAALQKIHLYAMRLGDLH